VAGTDGNGAFTSASGGRTWAAASNPWHVSRVNALVRDPNSPQIVYAGTVWGVYKSTDGGRSWRRAAGLTETTRVHALAIDPQDPRIVYAGTGRGVFKSTDGARTWRATGLVRVVSALAVDPGRPETVYAGTMRPGGVFKSTDGGSTWERRDVALRYRDSWVVRTLVVDPESPQAIYAGTDRGVVVKSTDGADSWSVILTTDGVNALALDPASLETVYAAGAGVFRSTNGGRMWRRLGTNLPGEVLSLALDSTTGSLYAGTDGGGVVDFRFAR
jgi:photosystem II stability/assembly factor-like uncharacterized protein